jgi:hypothetical protein
MMQSIVITGAASLLPEQTSHLYVEDIASPVMTFSAIETIEHKRQTMLSAQLLQLCQRLFHQAGWDADSLAGEETGLVSGAYYGCMSTTQEILTALRQKGPRGIDAIEFAKSTHSFPLSAASIAFSLLGPTAAVVSGECASLDALIMAQDWLRAGRCKQVIVVGYEHFSPLLQAHVQHQGIPGRYGDSLSVVMLETQSNALARSAPVIAELVGLRRFSGSAESVTRCWRAALHQIALSKEACSMHFLGSLQPAAKALEQTVTRDYRQFQRDLCSELPQALGAAAVMQLATLLQAPIRNTGREWALNTFAAGGGGMIHLRLEAL